MSDVADEALMVRYQQGDAAAFATLLQRHEQRVWNFIRRYVGDAATAEDLLQEVFMRVIKGAAQWTPQAKFTTWVFTIARNLCTDQARRNQHRKAASLDAAAERHAAADDSGPILLDKIAGADRGAEARLVDQEMIEQLDVALAGLPDEQREVFLMREVMDMSFAEIADAAGCNEATAKSRMRYALLRLREALADFRTEASDAPEAVGQAQQRGGLV